MKQVVTLPHVYLHPKLIPTHPGNPTALVSTASFPKLQIPVPLQFPPEGSGPSGLDPICVRAPHVRGKHTLAGGRCRQAQVLGDGAGCAGALRGLQGSAAGDLHQWPAAAAPGSANDDAGGQSLLQSQHHQFRHAATHAR